MVSEITEIKTEVVGKKALIIDEEMEFCWVLKYYLSKKDYNVATASNLSESLRAIDREMPDLIMADSYVHDNFENLLREKIRSIPGYSPQIVFTNAREPKRVGAVMYTLKRGEDVDLNSKIKRIISSIKDLFKL